MTWAKDQPKDGDVILHCAHLPGARWNWWLLDPPQPFKRPDKTQALARWIVACRTCAVLAGFEPQKVKISADSTWIGNEPFIPAQVSQ